MEMCGRHWFAPLGTDTFNERKNAQQEAALARTMPVILSNMNHLPSNTNKYCSNTSGSLILTLG